MTQSLAGLAAPALFPVAVGLLALTAGRIRRDHGHALTVDRLGLAQRSPPRWFDRRWRDLGLPRVDTAWMVAQTLGVLWSVVLVLSPVVGLLCGAGAIFVASVSNPVRRRILDRARSRQLPQALDTISSSLRAGKSMRESIRAAGGVGPPLGPELGSASTSMDKGATVADAMEIWSARADPATRTFVAVLAVGSHMGGNAARAVTAAANSLRDREALEREAVALATQARVSGIVLTIAPVLVATLLVTADSDAREFLLGTPLGLVCLTTGVLLDVAGAWWMSRMIDHAVRARA